MQSMITDDNQNVNIKMFVLDPLSTIVKLAILCNKSIGTKIQILNNIIYFQEVGFFQFLCRKYYGNARTDWHYLYNPIHIACASFLSTDIKRIHPRITILFEDALKGINIIKETYKHCAIMLQMLNYMYGIIRSHLDDTYHSNLFYKDGITLLYTKELTTQLNEQWTDNNIKVVLDIIEFLGQDEQRTINVKTLEDIMITIDANSHRIISNA
jgi:hypothetical protein